MLKLPIKTKRRAVFLRKKGYSIKEISQKVNIAVSTSSLWLRRIKLNGKARKRLEKRKLIGYYKSKLSWIRKAREENAIHRTVAENIAKKISSDANHLKTYCALLYWCEGTKNKGNKYVKFTNSDPLLVKTFITIFRKSFSLDENKFRALVHIHEYHNEREIKKFWSKTTNIPLKLFHRSYLKVNTKKRIRRDYKGCIAISYFDIRVYREITAIYSAFSEKWGHRLNSKLPLSKRGFLGANPGAPA